MSVQPLDVSYLTDRIADVSTAGQIYIHIPSTGRLEMVSSVLNGAIGTADAVLTVKQSGSATATLGTITITQSGSAAGDVDTLTLDTAVVEGDLIEIETNGASTNTISAGIGLSLRKRTA